VASLEQLVLDGLVLNDVTNYRLQAFDCPPPKKRYEWATGADADGAALVRDPLFENREVTARIRVTQRSTMDIALAAVAAISDKLEEAEKQVAGLDLVWTPADGTKAFTFKVLSGEITGLPVTMDGDDAGWFKRSPVVTVTFTCKPFGYGTEVVGSPTSSATPFVTLTVANVTGDVPAEGRLIVTDAATQARRYMEWGLEQRYYDAATSLLVDSDNMSTSGTAGSQTTRSGAYDPNATGNNVIRASLWRAPVSVAATGNLAHVGTFRVKARVYGAGTGSIYARLAWQEGDGPYRANAYTAVTLLGAFSEIDLGIISIPTKDLGTQRWAGRVEAYSETPADTLDVDYLVLVPAGEGYGKARGVGSITATAVNGYDDFATIGAGAALNTRVAPAGGTWATSGAATDFTAANPSTQQVGRTTASDASRRFAILGSTNYTDTQTEVFAQLQYPAAIAGVSAGVIARWVDSSNYVYASFSTAGFRIEQVVAGVTTNLRSVSGWFSPNVWWGIRLTAYASGALIAELRYGTGATQPTVVIRAYSSAVATGGALATGKPGFFDQNTNTTAANRVYDFFSTAAPSAEPIVINSTRALEVRSDGTLRADSSNTYWGPAPAYRGSRFMVPPAGDENRTSRVLVKAHRTDLEAADSTNVTDNLTVQVNYTPRYLVVPR
jgi:hypothetical protein